MNLYKVTGNDNPLEPSGDLVEYIAIAATEEGALQLGVEQNKEMQPEHMLVTLVGYALPEAEPTTLLELWNPNIY
jgi:hypothetical protein